MNLNKKTRQVICLVITAVMVIATVSMGLAAFI
jgi:hypothetical protein